jgi:hypothetical protein
MGRVQGIGGSAGEKYGVGCEELSRLQEGEAEPETGFGSAAAGGRVGPAWGLVVDDVEGKWSVKCTIEGTIGATDFSTRPRRGH